MIVKRSTQAICVTCLVSIFLFSLLLGTVAASTPKMGPSCIAQTQFSLIEQSEGTLLFDAEILNLTANRFGILSGIHCHFVHIGDVFEIRADVPDQVVIPADFSFRAKVGLEFYVPSGYGAEGFPPQIDLESITVLKEGTTDLSLARYFSEEFTYDSFPATPKEKRGENARPIQLSSYGPSCRIEAIVTREERLEDDPWQMSAIRVITKTLLDPTDTSYYVRNPNPNCDFIQPGDVFRVGSWFLNLNDHYWSSYAEQVVDSELLDNVHMTSEVNYLNERDVIRDDIIGILWHNSQITIPATDAREAIVLTSIANFGTNSVPDRREPVEEKPEEKQETEEIVTPPTSNEIEEKQTGFFTFFLRAVLDFFF